MKIITTPMCEEIVKLAGISDYVVNKFPDEEEGDLAILLSESKVEMNSLAIKINTPSQVFESIKKVSKITQNELSDVDVLTFFEDYGLCKKYLSSNPSYSSIVTSYFLRSFLMLLIFIIDIITEAFSTNFTSTNSKIKCFWINIFNNIA